MSKKQLETAEGMLTTAYTNGETMVVVKARALRVDGMIGPVCPHCGGCMFWFQEYPERNDGVCGGFGRTYAEEDFDWPESNRAVVYVEPEALIIWADRNFVCAHFQAGLSEAK